MLEGIYKTNKDKVKLLKDSDVIVRKNKKENKVALISGGGSGHEPAHAGYVGYGMLDAAVAGPVFTSPNPKNIYNAINEVKTDKGVLLIVKNYSGDVMNFKMAAKIARNNEIDVEIVIVNDDIAIEDPDNRRGIAGTIFVHKIVGAAAEKGVSLKEAKKIAEKVIENVKTKGVALAPCYSPTTGKPSFELGEDEIEIGLGIHGEPGIEITEMMTSKEIADNLFNDLISYFNFNHNKEYAIMINSLGATPLMELNILANDIDELVNKNDLNVYKYYLDSYMTSMEMKGVSLSLLELNNEFKELLEFESKTPFLFN